MRRIQCRNGLVFEIGSCRAKRRYIRVPMKLCLYFNEGAMLIPFAAYSRALLPGDEGEAVFPFRANGSQRRTETESRSSSVLFETDE